MTTVTARRVLALCPGITARQLRYWSDRGYLRVVNVGTGHGVDRRYIESEVEVARRMALLIGEGFRVDAAARLARETA